jgi:hypothetical protein
MPNSQDLHRTPDNFDRLRRRAGDWCGRFLPVDFPAR